MDLKNKSIPQIFLEQAKSKPDGIAFRYKDLGLYKEVQWKDYFEHVEDFCLGLLELDLMPEDRVAILGDCCPEWIYSSIAVECAGAIDYGIYSTSSPEEVRYLLENGEAKFVIVENQEYADKCFPFIDKLPFVKNLIVIDTSGMFAYDHPKIITYEQVEQAGKKRKENSKEDLHRYIKKIKGGGAAFIIYTSGTTGFPKGVMLTHQNIMVSFVEALVDYFPEINTHQHRIISHLSMAHILERCFSMYLPMVYDVEVFIGERVDYLQETLCEVQPTFFHGVPRIWEKMAGQMAVQITRSSGLKRFSYAWAMNISRRVLQFKWNHKSIPFTLRIFYGLANRFVFNPMLRNVGMRYVRYALSAGAPLPPAVQEVWQTWGVDLVNVYGSTEVGGLVTVQDPGFPKPGSLGRPTASWNRIKLADDGEILVAGPGVFKGYWREEKLTSSVLKNGWVHMGETGTFKEDGCLYFGERIKDIMVTSGGKNITPTLIENAVKGSPYISEVIVFADGRKYPAALIEIDFNTVSEWARRHKVLYTGFTTLTRHPKVNDLIDGEIEEGNRTLSRAEQIKSFRIIPKELDAEVGDTTPTRKIKRDHIYKLFQDLVEEMYVSSEAEKQIINAQLKGFPQRVKTKGSTI